MPYLVYQFHPRPLGPGALTIGSATEASWRILNHDLAPVHAIISLERDGSARVARGAPEASILVNGEELEGNAAYLRFGDTLRLNGVEMLYRQTLQEVSPRERYLRDTRRGRAHQLDGGVQIGRDPKCGIVIPEPEVSRVHIEIDFDGRRYWATPMHSAYTTVNGQRLARRTVLDEGDELGVGRTVLVFSTEAGPYRANPVGVARQVQGPSRSAKMQTMYMGAIEAQQRIERAQHRRVTLVISLLVLAALAVYALIAR